MRRSSEQTPKHIVEYAHGHGKHAVRKSVAGNLPVFHVWWLEMRCNRHGCSDTYTY